MKPGQVCSSLTNEELINRIGQAWDRSITINEVETHIIDKCDSGRPSLCCRCLMKPCKVRYQGIPYCLAHCPCPACTRNGDA